jgi:hypothetical protein
VIRRDQGLCAFAWANGLLLRTRLYDPGCYSQASYGESIAAYPDGRYLAVTLPLNKQAAEWRLVIVDWARKRVQPVCNDAVAYWSDDGGSFFVIGGYGKGSTTAQIYVIHLPVRDGIPEFPANGLSNISQIAGLKATRTISGTMGMIAPGRRPDTYAYVKETAQRNLYSIPLR